MSAGNRLRQAREDAGYVSAAAAAREFGWNEGSYRHHENGTRGFDSEQAAIYGKVYEVSPSWLLGLVADKVPSNHESLKALVEGFDPPSGEAREFEERLVEDYDSVLLHFVKFDSPILQNISIYLSSRRYIAFSRIIAESVGKAGFRQVIAMFADTAEMEPTIKVGELMLIDTAQRNPHHHDQIWLMSKAGKVLLRRLRFADQYRGEAIADNLSILPIAVDLLEGDFVIHGRVVWIGKEL
ncbi:helix-turn-helix domain-containing protein [Sphingomonas sp. CARO-RG-8B-R24-01]|uniref:helix-turn-helix domain-containing protein n=1 Tax=Sphingomonas sp. CARO-RG-8B-R24-01 TaxID=2914831 RepID=UPI001F56474C|nr:helix-turn-helix domain-containing protein [Sphingomonas sp. CARO-RG-8B-R24-01]